MKGILSITGIILSASILIGAYYYLSKTPYLEIRTITIEGGKRVSSQEIMDVAGVKTGENIMSLDLRAIKSRVEKLPWVREAAVQRVLPDSLKISTKERKPFALIDLDNTLYIIDDKGVVFKKADYRDGVDLPVITGVKMEALLALDENVTGPLFEALDFLRLVEKDGMFFMGWVSEVRADTHTGITVYTTGDPKVVMFGRGNLVEKIKRFKRLLDFLEGDFRKATSLDLTHGERAVVRWRT